MSSLTLTVQNRALVQAMQQSPRVLQRHMNKAVLRTVKEMARDARRNAPKAESTLTNSIGHKMIDPLTGEFGSGQNYARMVEEGTGSGGYPGIAAMEDWIHIKGIQPNDPTMDTKGLAFVMARSIAINGTPKQPYMKPAFESNKAKAERRIDQAISAAMKEIG